MRSSIRRESFLALAAGEGGGAAIAELKAAQGIKNRVLLRAVVEVSPDRPNVAAAYAVLAEVEHLAPGVVNEVVSCPAVGMWLGRALRGAADPGRMAAVALAASHRAGEARELRVNSHEGWITLPSAGGFPSEGGCLVGVGPGGVTADGRPVRGWRAPAVVDLGDHGIAIDDLDAYRWNPDGEDRPRLDATESAAWRRLLPEAWALLTERHATAKEEIAAAIGVLTPLGSPGGRPRSESSRDAFGAIALSRPRDAVALAEILVHETQHTKFYALNDLVPLLERDTGDRYYAAWRPDARPARGVLNGAYAYLGVTAFWRRQRHAEAGEAARRAETEFAQWREAAYDATRCLLAGAALTAEGAEFAETMAATLGCWLEEPVEPGPLARARELQGARREIWERRHNRSAGSVS